MKLKVENGRVTFNGQTLTDASLDIQLKSNELLEKVKGIEDYALNELIEMTKAKGRQLGVNIDFVTEKIN